MTSPHHHSSYQYAWMWEKPSHVSEFSLKISVLFLILHIPPSVVGLYRWQVLNMMLLINQRWRTSKMTKSAFRICHRVVQYNSTFESICIFSRLFASHLYLLRKYLLRNKSIFKWEKICWISAFHHHYSFFHFCF